MAIIPKRVALIWRIAQLADRRVLCPNGACDCRGGGIPASRSGGEKVCAQCRQLLPKPGRRPHRTAVVAVLGTGRCGRTSWIVRALNGLAEPAGAIEFPIPGQMEAWQQSRSLLAHGRPLSVTVPTPAPAWCVDTRRDGENYRIYLHDTGGREAVEERLLRRRLSLRRINALVLVLDPFGISDVWRKYGPVVEGMHPPVWPSPYCYDVPHLSALVRVLDRLRGKPRRQQWEISVAVVVSKLDVQGLVREFSGCDKSDEAAAMQACQSRLVASRYGNLVRALEQRFSKTAYFPCHPFRSGPCSPVAPLLWLTEAIRSHGSAPAGAPNAHGTVHGKQ